MRIRSFVTELAITIGLSLLIFVVLHNTVQRTIIDGSSMEPNFHNREQALMNVAVYKYFHAPERGDVVVLIPPIEPDKMFVKRVIGQPGDTVEVKSGTVFVNGVALKEPYITNKPTYSYGPYSVPPGYYFVLGDNRNNSNDSHHGWVVAEDKIVAKVFLRIWPPGEWGLVPNYDLAEQLGKNSLNNAFAPLGRATVAAGW